MAHGGARAGSGRKGGIPDRQKKLAKCIDECRTGKLSPLQYLVNLYNNPSPEIPESMRLEAALGAAPFLHPKLTTLQVPPKVDESGIPIIDVAPGDASAPGRSGPRVTTLVIQPVASQPIV